MFKFNKAIFFIIIIGSFNLITFSQVKISLNVDTPGVAVSQYLYGIFFEDINHAADGGLYAEMVSNRSFEDNTSYPENWQLIIKNGATGSISLDNTNLLNNAQTYCLKIVANSIPENGKIGVANSGFWGMNIKYGETYNFSFFAKSNDNFKGKVTITLENSDGTVIFAQNTITGLTSQWNKFTCTLKSNGTASNGRLAIYVDTIGTMWIDVVSLFPPTYKNRPNGLRQDIAQMIEDLKPSFMRFPGGCFVEGDYMANRFQWKKTIGNIEDRPGHWNLWGYRTTDGMGYHEYLQFAEDIGADAMYVINVGLAHNDFVPYNQLDSLIQEALDAIEYAIGDTNTKYGKLRALNGHPDPFNLKFIELGNENSYGDHYAERYIAFYNAIKTKYPHLKIIGNVEAWGTDYPSWKVNAPVDLVDEHYYRDPQWFIRMATRYDKYDRNSPKVYVGEYAVTSNCGYGNLIAAVAEAAFMTGFERNPDIVLMSSYAPLLVNVNNRAWNPDLINFNSSQCYGTPSYYVQKLFSNNVGDIYLPVKEENNIVSSNSIYGKIGVGTWITQSKYDDIIIKNGKNEILFNDNFENNSGNWTIYKGTWNIQNGTFVQSSNLEDCRAIATYISDTSYTITLKAMKISGNEGFLIIFGYIDDNNFYWWNIGGWGNTRHAIEKCSGGVKSQIASINGSILSNKWYDIKIEITNERIKCYLDNILIHDYIPEPIKKLYVSTTKNTKTNEYIMKIVNVTDQPVATNVIIKTQTGHSIQGTNQILTSTNKYDENTFLEPKKVSPTVLNFTYPLNFYHTFPAFSVNIMKFKIVPTTNKKKENNLIDNQIKIYPNPIKNKFTISLPETELRKDFLLTITDIHGKIIFQNRFKYNGNNSFVINDLENGIYNLNIKNSEKSFNKKVVIVK